MDAVMMGGLTLLLVFPISNEGNFSLGVLNSEEALAGFSNSGIFTVGILFIVAAAMRSTGAIDFVMNRLMGNPSGVRSAISRIFLPVFGVSAFLNNTPVVAMMIPGVLDWAKRLKISPSKLMIPLSYSAIL